MQPRKRLLASVLAGLLAFAGLACEAEFEGDPLQDDGQLEDDAELEGDAQLEDDTADDDGY